MDARKRMAFILTVLLFGMGGHAAFAEAQYTARDKNGQIVKQGTTTENEEFLAIDGLEYEFNGEHRIHQGESWAGYIFGNGTKANIKGNVIGGTGIQLRNQAEITVTGDVTATLKEIDYTDVDYFNEYGEWRMYCGNAIRAFIWDYDQSKNLKIKVKGNVIATGDGIIAEYGNFVIEGDVVSEFENGINVLEGFPVFIDVVGNVEGNVRQSAVSIMPNAEDQVVVRGKIEARGKQSAVDIYDVTFEYDPAETLRNLPQIMVKEITVESGDYFTATVHHLGVEEWLEDSKDLAEATAKATWYIVDINQPTNGKVEVKGTSTKEGLLVAHEGDKLTVTGTPKKGYRLTGIDAGSKALVTENEDGTYTVTVERGCDVTISALFEAAPEMPQTGDQMQIGRTILFMAASIAMLVFLRKPKRE